MLVVRVLGHLELLACLIIMLLVVEQLELVLRVILIMPALLHLLGWLGLPWASNLAVLSLNCLDAVLTGSIEGDIVVADPFGEGVAVGARDHGIDVVLVVGGSVVIRDCAGLAQFLFEEAATARDLCEVFSAEVSSVLENHWTVLF